MSDTYDHFDSCWVNQTVAARWWISDCDVNFKAKRVQLRSLGGSVSPNLIWPTGFIVIKRTGGKTLNFQTHGRDKPQCLNCLFMRFVIIDSGWIDGESHWKLSNAIWRLLIANGRRSTEYICTYWWHVTLQLAVCITFAFPPIMLRDNVIFPRFWRSILFDASNQITLRCIVSRNTTLWRLFQLHFKQFHLTSSLRLCSGCAIYYTVEA